jgi:hypothetical protein
MKSFKIGLATVLVILGFALVVLYTFTRVAATGAIGTITIFLGAFGGGIKYLIE